MRVRNTIRALALALALALSSTLVVDVQHASADPFPDNQQSLIADSKWHTWCHFLGTEMADVQPTMDRLAANTVLGEWEESCTDWTDVKFANGGFREGRLGKAVCWDDNTADGKCGTWQVWIYPGTTYAQVPVQFWAASVQKTIMHEVGHTLGLNHHDDFGAAMKSGPIYSNDLWRRRFSIHDKAHINTTYGDR